MASRIAVVDLGTGAVRSGASPRTDRDEAVIVSLAGEEATARRAECAAGRLTVNIADRPFRVWKISAGGRRQLVLEGFGLGSEAFDTSGGAFEVTIEAKGAR